MYTRMIDDGVQTHTHTTRASTILRSEPSSRATVLSSSTQNINISSVTPAHRPIWYGIYSVNVHGTRPHTCTIRPSVLPSPYTVSSWILAVDWRLPVCNTLPFLSEMALRRFPDKTATREEETWETWSVYMDIHRPVWSIPGVFNVFQAKDPQTDGEMDFILYIV